MQAGVTRGYDQRSEGGAIQWWHQYPMKIASEHPRSPAAVISDDDEHARLGMALRSLRAGRGSVGRRSLTGHIPERLRHGRQGVRSLIRRRRAEGSPDVVDALLRAGAEPRLRQRPDALTRGSTTATRTWPLHSRSLRDSHVVPPLAAGAGERLRADRALIEARFDQSARSCVCDLLRHAQHPAPACGRGRRPAVFSRRAGRRCRPPPLCPPLGAGAARAHIGTAGSSRPPRAAPRSRFRCLTAVWAQFYAI